MPSDDLSFIYSRCLSISSFSIYLGIIPIISQSTNIPKSTPKPFLKLNREEIRNQDCPFSFCHFPPSLRPSCCIFSKAVETDECIIVNV